MELAEVENNLVSPSSVLKHNVEALKARNKELNIDISILKRLVYMLNVELELRDSNKQENRNELGSQHGNVVTFKPVDQILHWNHEDIVMIDPLLTAFQQTKEEKDQLVTNYKSIFEDLSTRCKATILENDTLREELRNTKAKANSSYSEWKKLHQEFLLVKEHNQLMTRQIKLFQSKVRSIESVYKTSLKQYEIERQDLMEKFDATKTELLVLKGRLSVLTQVSNQIRHQNEDQNDANFCNVITKEIHDLSVELKLHNAKDTDWMKKKITDLENEKAITDVEIAKLSSERDHLKGYISAVELEARWRRMRYLDMNRTDWIPSTVIAAAVLHNICLMDPEDHMDLEMYVNEGLIVLQVPENFIPNADENLEPNDDEHSDAYVAEDGRVRRDTIAARLRN